MTTEIADLLETQSRQTDPAATVNEALRQFEGRTIRVLSRSASAQPPLPSAGDTYIIPSGATGDDWGTMAADDIAHFYGGVWHSWQPSAGIRVTVLDETLLAGRPVTVVYTGNAWVRVPGLFTVPTKTVSSNYIVPVGELGYLFLIDTSGGNVTLTLPATAAAGDGAVVAAVKIADANQAIVDGDSAETINGEETVVLEDQWASTQIVSGQGSQWYAFGGGGSASFPFTDDEDLFAAAADLTKILRFSLSGLTTGTTRTATWPDKDGTVAMLSDVTGGGNASTEFDEDAGNTTGLTWAWNAGAILIGHEIHDISAGTIALTDDATNYIYIDLADQTVKANTTGFPWGCYPLREVVTSGGSQTSSTDRRAWVTTEHRDTWAQADLTSGTLTIDLRQGRNFHVTLDQDVTTVTVSNLPASGYSGDITLEIAQDATGGRTVAGWPSAVKWPGGSAPTITSTANAVDVITGYVRDGSTIRLARAFEDSK